MGADSSKPEQDQQVRVLLEDIRKRSVKLSSSCENEAVRIVLCGYTRSGKSSLVNNILSAVKGVLVHTAIVGSLYAPVTEKYTEYNIDIPDTDMNGRKKYISVCDTMGFELNMPVEHVDSVRAVLEGYCASNQSMVKMQTVEGKKREKRQAAYLIFVFDATRIETEIDDRCLMIESLHMFAMKEQIPVCVFLTCCDKLDKDVDKDKENIFKSAKVKRSINVAHEKFKCVPKGRIYPIVNYTDQRDVEPQMRLLTLRAVCDIIRDVESHMADVVRDA